MRSSEDGYPSACSRSFQAMQTISLVRRSEAASSVSGPYAWYAMKSSKAAHMPGSSTRRGSVGLMQFAQESYRSTSVIGGGRSPTSAGLRTGQRGVTSMRKSTRCAARRRAARDTHARMISRAGTRAGRRVLSDGRSARAAAVCPVAKLTCARAMPRVGKCQPRHLGTGAGHMGQGSGRRAHGPRDRAQGTWAKDGVPHCARTARRTSELSDWNSGSCRAMHREPRDKRGPTDSTLKSLASTCKASPTMCRPAATRRAQTARRMLPHADARSEQRERHGG